MRVFCAFQVGESEPFVSELLSGLATIVGDLQPHQIHTFYESVRIFSRVSFIEMGSYSLS
jgi:hypothetical protein